MNSQVPQTINNAILLAAEALEGLDWDPASKETAIRRIRQLIDWQTAKIPEYLELLLQGDQDLHLAIEHCSVWRVFLFDCAVSLDEHVAKAEDADLSTALTKLADAAKGLA